MSSEQPLTFFWVALNTVYSIDCSKTQPSNYSTALGICCGRIVSRTSCHLPAIASSSSCPTTTSMSSGWEPQSASSRGIGFNFGISPFEALGLGCRPMRR